MGSVVAEKKPLEDGRSSLRISPPIYKRRKVSAIRDYPDGCGPHAARINLKIKEVEINGQKEGGVLSNVESSREKGGDLCEMVKFSKEKVESKSNNSPVCPNGVNLVEGDGVERLDEEFLKPPPEPSSKVLLNKDEGSKRKNDILEASKDLMERRLDSPSAQMDIDVLDLKKPTDVLDNKPVDEGTGVQPCSLPHYPIPLNLVWKEPKYPPRRRVSAVRDFPPGCGRNVPSLGDTEDKLIDHGELNSKIDKAVLLNDTNQIEVEHQANNGFKDQEEGLVSSNVGDAIEHYSGADNTPVNKSHEIKGQELFSKEKSDEQHEKDMEQLEYSGRDEEDTGSFRAELNKEIMVYVKDRSKKKKVVDVQCSNVGLQEENIVGVGSLKNMVVVQGLMSALHCPWRQGKETVKTTPAVASVKRKRRSRCGFTSQDKNKNESKDDTMNLANKSTEMIPHLEVKDLDEVPRPLDVRDDDDISSENDELNDYQFLRRERFCDISLPPFGAGSSGERGIRSKVRETLRLFQVVHRKLVQEDETKPKDDENASKRADLRAAKVLKDHGKYMNTEKNIGPVPGVEVGDIFNYRIELAIIGLHGPLQSGIDTTKLDKQPIAISIVASGGYANDVDSSDVLIYTGQGGNATGSDKQPEDQKLERGNLALKNCIDKKTLVRVIRGFKETKPSETSEGRSKTVATYTYDGLYTVEKYWHDLGTHGKLVYKFELRRVPGQPELAWKEVKQSKKHKAREGHCVADISEGKENFPICAVNTINDEKPPPFTYITSMMYPDWCQPITPKGCDCKNGCSDSEHCACAVKNGGEIPFNHSGAIIQAKPLVYECGPMCKCPPSCHNRVSQHGIKLPLEVFKTESRGWGVRCLSAIPSGSFICEYIGELLDDKEAEQRTGNDEYLFDIGQNYNDSTLWDGLSSLLHDMPSSSTSDVVENIGFTIDAVNYGNIGRFINHSCTPNLYAQNILYDHEDKRIPHIMLFAAENIPPLQELAYHYNYTLDQVLDSQGNIKKKSCYCGSAECTGRMY
ncbi:Histone-lysine N-methyltransferase H3 lysine-9 specific SUVH6 [Bienertia sinuspersici]